MNGGVVVAMVEKEEAMDGTSEVSTQEKGGRSVEVMGGGPMWGRHRVAWRRPRVCGRSARGRGCPLAAPASRTS